MNQALALASQAAAQFLPAIVAVEHRRDTAFPDSPECYVVNESRFGAVVVYLDEPDTIVSTSNYDGRFQAVTP
jgi:hypothetical protein